MKLPAKCLLFDYGGTLDTPGEHWSTVIARAWAQEGIELPREAFRHAYVEAERALAADGAVGTDDTFGEMMEKKIAIENTALGSIADADTCRRVAQRCYEYARSNLMQVRPTLESLASKVPLGIVSNFYGNLRAVLADMGVAHLFSAITDSGEAGVRKPDPRIFLEALRRVDPSLTPAETLVVGDSIDKDILPAHSAGFLTAHLPGIPWNPEAPQPPLPADTAVISSIADLLHI
ncbi:MAG: HAD family hydrolase [Duncaniella sp.]|nr:HAD family hydrolase [Duncaniella sp.]